MQGVYMCVMGRTGWGMFVNEKGVQGEVNKGEKSACRWLFAASNSC